MGDRALAVARIREVANEWGGFEPGVEGTLLPFADFLINSHAYAIRVSATDAAVFLVGDGFRLIECAGSFDEFVTRYEHDHPAIYGA